MRKFVRIRTKNSTAKPLRGAMLVDDWSVVRLGSVTETREIFPNQHRNCIEVNTTESVRNSSSKLRMKRCFATKNVPQAFGWTTEDRKSFNPLYGTTKTTSTLEELPYPIVAKKVFGCQGRGMEFIEDTAAMKKFMKKISSLSSYIFEEFHNYGKEYRLHVGHGVGVFMSWRKLRTKEATERWFFNNTNSNWVGPDHALFDKPTCWKAMEKAAVDALNSCGLDIGACDIRVQTNKNKEPKFIICEINSAPALGDMGIEKYKEVIPKIIKLKKDGK